MKLILSLLIVIMGVYALSMMGLGKDGDPNNSSEDEAHSSLDDDDDDDVPSRVVNIEGKVAVRLPIELQEQNGIETEIIGTMTLHEEVDGFGRVLNINELIQLRSESNAVNSDKKIRQSKLTASDQKLKRLKELRKQSANISLREVQEAEAEMTIHRAEVSSLKQKSNDLKVQAEQKWGTILAEWALNDDSIEFREILAGEKVILFVSLKVGDSLPEGIDAIFVGRHSDRALAQKAEYISSAVAADHVMSGETYYFITENKQQFRADMHVHVWVPQSQEAIEGVFVPESAVIWSGGKQWIYLKQGNDIFVKKIIQNVIETNNGLFVTEGLGVDDEVVVSGAQMLNAEEYRWSIPDEDDNP